jgi:hypothetical protein
MTGLQAQPKDMLMNTGLIPDLVAESNLFASFPSCIKALQEGQFGS